MWAWVRRQMYFDNSGDRYGLSGLAAFTGWFLQFPELKYSGVGLFCAFGLVQLFGFTTYRLRRFRHCAINDHFRWKGGVFSKISTSAAVDLMSQEEVAFTPDDLVWLTKLARSIYDID